MPRRSIGRVLPAAPGTCQAVPEVTPGAGNLPGGTGGDAVHHGGTGAANEQGGFLLQGHRLDDFFDVVLAQLRLGKGAERHDERCNGQ